MSDAVAARMVADVPVGAFLSGGIDSTTIVALMQRHASGPVHTFTVGFADRSFDESPEAAAVAAYLGDGPYGRPGRRCRGGRGDRPPSGHMGRALRRRLPDPHLPGQPGGVPGGHRVVVGRRRGRVVRRLQPARLARPCVGKGRHGAGRGPPDGRLGPGPHPARRGRESGPGHQRPAGRLAGAEPIQQGGQAGPGPLRLGPRGRLSGSDHPLGPTTSAGSGTTTRTHLATRSGHRSPRAGSRSRCSGSTWSAICPMTSSPSWIERPWPCPLRRGLRSSIERSSTWPGACRSMPSCGEARPNGCCARCSNAMYQRRSSNVRRWVSACPSDHGCVGSSPPGPNTCWTSDDCVPRGCWTQFPFAGPGTSTGRAGGTWATNSGTCWSSSRGSTGGCDALG